MDKYKGVEIGIVVDCEGGSLVIGNYGSATIHDPNDAVVKEFKGSTSHFANFFDAVRSRNCTDLHADILEGHLSSALCHTGNISYRLGRPHSSMEIRDTVKNNNDLEEAIGRMEEHLGANKVDLAKSPATLGALLTMDPASERFIDNKEANQLLTREYRAPFVVPEKV